jgi:hypothetical protein
MLRKMMMAQAPPLLVLVVVLLLSLLSSAPPTAAQSSIATMSSGPMELTLIPHALSGQDCSMAVCPEDTVTNFFFNDVIPNEDPCYLAELIKGSADGTSSPNPPSLSSEF